MKKLLLFSTLAAAAGTASLTTGQAGVTITPAAGFGITWDGNDGAFFNADPALAMAPNNAALASNGGVAIASSESPFVPTHQIVNLNDGFYGNNRSHINSGAPAPAWSGVILPGQMPISSFAFGRDNGNGNWDDTLSPPGNDACGGQCDDRWGAGGAGLGAPGGTYDLQFTTDGGGSWTSIGLLAYDGVGGDIAPGGAFTPWLRHEYGISQGGGPVVADGLRLILPGAGDNVAIDEFEIFAVPEPSGVALLGLGLCGLFLRRRR